MDDVLRRTCVVYDFDETMGDERAGRRQETCEGKDDGTWTVVEALLLSWFTVAHVASARRVCSSEVSKLMIGQWHMCDDTD